MGQLAKELTPELQKRGITIEVGGHGYENFINAEMQDGKLFAEHHDWFGQDENGQRVKAKNRVFCTSNPQAVDFVVANVVAYLTAGRRPGAGRRAAARAGRRRAARSRRAPPAGRPGRARRPPSRRGSCGRREHAARRRARAALEPRHWRSRGRTAPRRRRRTRASRPARARRRPPRRGRAPARACRKHDLRSVSALLCNSYGLHGVPASWYRNGKRK